MKKYSDDNAEFNLLRDKIVGLGEHSIKKNYYPQLQKRIAELEISETKNNALIKTVPDMLVLLDKSGKVIDYSPGRDMELKCESQNIINTNIRNIKPFWISEVFLNNVEEILEKKELKEFEYEFEQNGDKKYFEIRAVSCGENEVLFIIRDITERKRLENKLIYMGTMDYLTGLYNRSYFEQAKKEIVMNSKKSIGLVICDIDGLKLINDTLGHIVGDLALKKTGNIINECFPRDSIAARIGGDEFGILVFDVNAEALEKACNMVCFKGQQLNMLNLGIYLSISTGFALTQAPLESEFEKLFTQADNDMYRNKLLRSKSVKNAIVKTLMKAMEERDFITEGHANRMEKVVLIISKNLGLKESMINEVRLLAQFHDLGKVGVPDNVLQKPGRLTQEEKNIMQMHSIIGQRIANASAELEHIADLILKHHEKWDGTGYPLGIKGKSIPLECRILAIADAYDAMTNDRPYRKALPVSEAIEEIKKCSGTQFDPELASLFIELIESDELIVF